VRTKSAKILLSLVTVALASTLSASPAIASNGYTWTNATPSSPYAGVGYQDIVSSSSGKYLAATQVNADIITSSDYGATWVNRTASTALSGSHWQNIASDASGQHLVAPVYNGDVQTSSDYGATWADRAAAGSRAWQEAASSSDGKYLAANADGGHVWTSSDYGATWTDRAAAGARTWRGIASSGSGQVIVATVQNGDLYRSSDYGATWTNLTSGVAAMHNKQWEKLDVSNDGSTIAAAIFGGHVFTSANSGSTWTDQSSLGNGSWDAVAVSYLGAHFAVGSVAGDVFTSDDSGATWTNSTSSTSASGKFWSGLDFSGSGQRLVASDSGGGNLWTANNPAYTAAQPGVTNSTTTVTANGSVEVDVLGGISGFPDAATLAITSSPSHGMAVDPPGTITYTPAVGYVGSDSLSYQVCSTLDPTVCKGAVLDFSVVPGAPGTGAIRPSWPAGLPLGVLSLMSILVGAGLSRPRRIKSAS